MQSATAVADEARPEEARARDARRKPAEILALAQIDPGQTIVDIASSSNYYAPMLSAIAGPDDQLIMIEPKRLEPVLPQILDRVAAYAAESENDNITSVRVNLDELSFAAPVDRVLNILYYHDTVWTGVDRDKMNSAIFDALAPGGYYLVADHLAKVGAGDGVTQELHRIDATGLIEEIKRAGFELAADSDLLRNEEDTRETGVFDPSIRGKTDRFVYLFKKPE